MLVTCCAQNSNELVEVIFWSFNKGIQQHTVLCWRKPFYLKCENWRFGSSIRMTFRTVRE
jgi:hypothetical protein